MNSDPVKRFAELLNTWLQNVAILAAGIWAINTFVYKEVILPHAVLSHLNVRLELRSDGTRRSGSQPVAERMAVVLSITNGSTRTIYNLGGAVGIWGNRYSGVYMGPRSLDDSTTYALLSRDPKPFHRDYFPFESSLVALIPLFSPVSLNPGESVSNEYLFHVANDQFDFLHALAVVPSGRKDNSAAIRWTPNNGDLVPSFFSASADGSLTEIPQTELDMWKKSIERKVEMQLSHERATLDFAKRQ